MKRESLLRVGDSCAEFGFMEKVVPNDYEEHSRFINYGMRDPR
jgi:hypothetical protein